MTGRARHRAFGYIRTLPSGRYQASYVGPDGVRYAAVETFEAKSDAEGWLAAERRTVAGPDWMPPRDREAAERARAAERAATESLTFAEYARAWLDRRAAGELGRAPLKARTLEHYEALLERFLVPAFGSMALVTVTPDQVAQWHNALRRQTGPTYRAHAYSLLRTIYLAAARDPKVPLAASPCQVEGAGKASRARRIEPASLRELEVLTNAMPDRLRTMVLLMAWCALRFGEAAELRRKDVDLKRGLLRIRRGVVRVNGAVRVETPKSEAGVRDVAIPPHLIPVLKRHLDSGVDRPASALLFPGRDGHLPHSTFLGYFHQAAEAAGRPDLTPHGLRHTGAVLAAQTGATLAELMARLGHSTPTAALRYQHAARGRDAQIAELLSRMAADAARDGEA